jgi:hypothetical protein
VVLSVVVVVVRAVVVVEWVGTALHQSQPSHHRITQRSPQHRQAAQHLQHCDAIEQAERPMSQNNNAHNWITR